MQLIKRCIIGVSPSAAIDIYDNDGSDVIIYI